MKIIEELNKKDCYRCIDLIGKPTIPRGNATPKYMIIGENPSWRSHRYDGKNKLMWYGKSRTYDFLKSVLYGLRIYNDCWFTNIVRCYAENNRELKKYEVMNCSRLWVKEIHHLKPQFIICLGRTAEKYVKMVLKENEINIKVVEIPHPSFCVRFGKKKEDIIGNLKKELKLC